EPQPSTRYAARYAPVAEPLRRAPLEEPPTKHRQHLTRLRIVAILRPRSPTYRLGMRAPCVLGWLDSRRLSHHRHFVRGSNPRSYTGSNGAVALRAPSRAASPPRPGA